MATKSVAELQAELAQDVEKETGIVASPQAATPAALAPAARLGWLRQVLSDLHLDASFLEPAAELAARASAVRRDAALAAQQATARRHAALSRLGRDSQARLAETVELWQAQGVWLDTQPDQQRSIGLELAERGARQIEGGISVQILGHAPRLFDVAQRKAAEIVAEVGSLPAMPKDVYQTSDPAGELARYREHRATWGAMLAAYHDFWTCHAIGDLAREQLGYGFPSFPLGAPRTALWLKNWRIELGDNEFARIKPQLRIRYAIDKGFGPGLWAPRDVEESRPEDRTFGGRLRNLGAAVGVPGFGI